MLVCILAYVASTGYVLVCVMYVACVVCVV